MSMSELVSWFPGLMHGSPNYQAHASRAGFWGGAWRRVQGLLALST